jgi:4-diphosphocytidyl-2-C-methyl-D-erythritol kinase
MKHPKKIILKAPAKLNLYLDVLRKRRDDYHDIETLFERISLCDEITLKERKSGIKVRCSNRSIPSGSKNLAYKAAKLLQRHFSIQKGVDIYIKKKIPVASGLGGGSSDAATVLLGLVDLWGINISRKKLFDIGKTLGADVGFFLLQRPFAIGTGKGDKLASVKNGKILWHVLVNPGLKSSTKSAYSRVNCSLTCRGGGAKIMANAIEKANYGAASDLAHNSFEQIIVDANKKLTKLKERLLVLGAEKVYLSGSGPTFFTIHRTQKKAFSFFRKARKLGARAMVAHTL